MTDDKFIYPAITALIFCALFPSYWIWFATSGFDLPGYGLPSRSNLEFDFFLWLALGLMLFYIYLSLKRILPVLHNYSRLTIPLYFAIGSTIFMFGGIAILEIILVGFGGSLSKPTSEMILGGIAVIFLSGIIIQGVIDILIGAILLRDSQDLPNILTIFAVITLINGILGATVLLAIGNIVITPLSFLVLAVYFLKRPEIIDVV